MSLNLQPPTIDTKPLKKTRGKQKIKIEFIEQKQRRQITFYKRKAGLIKKAHELQCLTGTNVMLLMASETGHVYTYATPDLQPMITNTENQALIKACLGQKTGQPTQFTHVSSNDVQDTPVVTTGVTEPYQEPPEKAFQEEKQMMNLPPIRSLLSSDFQFANYDYGHEFEQ
jgi:serum response factor